MTSPQTIMHLIRHLAQPRRIPLGELSKRAGMGETHLNMPRENKAGIATGTLTAYLRVLEEAKPLTHDEEQRLLGVIRGEELYVPAVDARKFRVDSQRVTIGNHYQQVRDAAPSKGKFCKKDRHEA